MRKRISLHMLFLLVGTLATSLVAFADTCSSGFTTYPASPPNQQVCDLNTNTSSATINDGLFGAVLETPKGTGVFNPFLRVQQGNDPNPPHGPNTWESGWNEDYKNPGDVPANTDAKSDPHTHEVLLSDLAVFTVGGKTYYEFTLDLAEPNDGSAALISLNNVSIFDNLIADPSDSTCPTGTGTQVAPSCLGHLDWSMDGGAFDSSVTLHSNLHPGNGVDNLTLFVPTSAFADAAPGAYMIFYTQFGIPPGQYSTDASFEEWAVKTGPNAPNPVPEPASLMLLGTGLLSVAGIVRRKLRA